MATELNDISFKNTSPQEGHHAVSRLSKQPLSGDSLNMEDRDVKIYILIDPFTNRVRYVGKTVMTLDWRLKYHIKQHSNMPKVDWLTSIIKKKSYPIIRQIDVIKESKWIEAEKYWIKFYKELHGNLFNIACGGGAKSKVKRKPHSEGWKKANSERHKGNKYNLGKKHTEENNAKRRKFTKEQYESGVRKSRKGISIVGNKKAIIQYDLKGNFIKKFDSTSEAALELGIGRRSICENLRGANKTACGFIWKKNLENNI